MKASLKKNKNKTEIVYNLSITSFELSLVRSVTSPLAASSLWKKKKNYGSGVINKS